MFRFNDFAMAGVFILMALTARPAWAANLASNGSFENGPTGIAVTPEDWTLLSGPDFDVIVDTETEVHATDGMNWLQLEIFNSANSAYLFQVTPHIIQEGWTYEVFANARIFNGGTAPEMAYRTLLLSTPNPDNLDGSRNFVVMLHDLESTGAVDPMPEYHDTVVGSGQHVGKYLAVAVNAFGGAGTFGWDNIRVNAISPLHPGDFDSDGDVDGADFVAWQTHFPTASGATLADGDADGDADVDGADFVVWQTNFPFTPAPGIATIPEPLSGMLLAFGGCICVAYRRFVVQRRRST